MFHNNQSITHNFSLHVILFFSETVNGGVNVSDQPLGLHPNRCFFISSSIPNHILFSVSDQNWLEVELKLFKNAAFHLIFCDKKQANQE